jgi:Cys-tRNA synthase (O-phospho-L-seryl-tRNA:Cys-tRNA synthase)
MKMEKRRGEVAGDRVMELRNSKHAQTRIRQRGFRDSDIDFVRKHGTDVDAGSLLTDKDAQRGIEAAKKQIRDLNRLKGTAVIVGGDTAVSIYRPDKRRFKKLIGLW